MYDDDAPSNKNGHPPLPRLRARLLATLRGASLRRAQLTCRAHASCSDRAHSPTYTSPLAEMRVPAPCFFVPHPLTVVNVTRGENISAGTVPFVLLDRRSRCRHFHWRRCTCHARRASCRARTDLRMCFRMPRGIGLARASCHPRTARGDARHGVSYRCT